MKLKKRFLNAIMKHALDLDVIDHLNQTRMKDSPVKESVVWGVID